MPCSLCSFKAAICCVWAEHQKFFAAALDTATEDSVAWHLCSESCRKRASTCVCETPGARPAQAGILSKCPTKHDHRWQTPVHRSALERECYSYEDQNDKTNKTHARLQNLVSCLLRHPTVGALQTQTLPYKETGITYVKHFKTNPLWGSI